MLKSGITDTPPEIQDKHEQKTRLVCAHCGLDCPNDSVHLGDLYFCCQGCKKVYELLHANEMCAYYDLNEKPGITPQQDTSNLKYGFLDEEEIQQKLKEFSDGTTARVTFHIPAMHCASCIYLLERLNQLDSAITNSRVNFVRKELTLTYREEERSLREVVELIASLGYEPRIRLEDVEKKGRKDDRKKLYMQIGVAGFAFGNIMLLSFPEYLAHGTESVETFLRNLFVWVSAILSIPVVVFSGQDYLTSAWKGLRHKVVNLDVPISLGILALMGRSWFEIISGVGVGYFDSLSGLIFLLLLGKLFQAKTYETLSFERDYTAYFPVAVLKKEIDCERSVPVMSLEPGDRIVIRNQELIPADSILIAGDGAIDYSFVTGESQPVPKENGDIIYAGGRQIGEAIELDVIEKVSQSYLTRLWNHDSFTDQETRGTASLANRISKHFVAAVLLIALGAFLLHLPSDAGLAFQVLTAVLIVACPCALALATPFTLGTTMRIFGRNDLYLKNADVVERMAHVTSLIFDKTGTLTQSGTGEIQRIGEELGEDQLSLVKSLIRHSTHPLSMRLYAGLQAPVHPVVENFREYPGRGIEGIVQGQKIRVGSRTFTGAGDITDNIGLENLVGETHFSINDVYSGGFRIQTQLRPGLQGLIDRLKQRFNLALLSGDTEREKELLQPIFPNDTPMQFNQSPHDKLQYIKSQQKEGKKVLMVGDGLNDAGALQASHVGIALTEDVTAFSPASDALLDANTLGELDRFLCFSRIAVRIIIAGFVLSFLYNIIGLSFAVAGKLSPLVSAILMPASSISVVAFATFYTRWRAKMYGLRI